MLLQSSDLFWQTNLAPVAKRLMEQAGFKVDMQPMDWQSIIIRASKKNPPEAGRLACLSRLAVGDGPRRPGARTSYLNSSCEKALNGWPCDPEMEKLRDRSPARPTRPS